MKSKVVERMLTNMPNDVKIFVDKYAEIIVRVNRLLKKRILLKIKKYEKNRN